MMSSDGKMLRRKITAALAVLVVFAIIIVGCSPQPQFDPEFNKEVDVIKVQLITYDSRRDLNRAYNEWVGPHHSVDLDTNQLGWATWTTDTCTIHINGALKTSNRKEYLYTLGHEYAHCIYGRYHD